MNISLLDAAILPLHLNISILESVRVKPRLDASNDTNKSHSIHPLSAVIEVAVFIFTISSFMIMS